MISAAWDVRFVGGGKKEFEGELGANKCGEGCHRISLLAANGSNAADSFFIFSTFSF